MCATPRHYPALATALEQARWFDESMVGSDASSDLGGPSDKPASLYLPSK